MEFQVSTIKSILSSLVIVLAGCATKYECPQAANEYSGKVCGLSFGIYCVRAPCPKYIQTTYENSEAACDDSQQYYVEGECDTEGAVYSFFDKRMLDTEDGS